MATAFNRALAFALRWEGGYSNHPSDTGGETNRGITWRTYNSYRHSRGLPVRSVKFLEQRELEEIYKKQYWDAARCDLLPDKLAIAHFDWAVNAGVGRANRTLQQIVGADADGIIGPRSVVAVRAAATIHSEVVLVKAYCDNREGCYRRWGKGSQAVFLRGWLNRLTALRRELA